MASAVCGDDVYREDKTIVELESRLASLTGHESALFVLTCTMANFLGLAATSNRGEEILCGDMSHIGLYEQNNVSQFTGIGMRTVKNELDGTISLEDVRKRGYFSNDDFHMSHSKVICVENTHNFTGGKPLTLEYLQKLRSLSAETGCNVHMDGARLINASIGTGVSLKEYCQFVDTATMCFTKGMSCPFGAALIGNEEVIKRARRMRKAIGGQWRQGGIAAAAVLESLDDFTPIENDHDMAKLWASAIPKNSQKVTVDEPQTNIVIFKCQSEALAQNIIEEMGKGDLSVLLQQGANPEDVRAVFHRSADYSFISEAVEKLQQLL